MLSSLDIEEICNKMNLPLVGVFSKDKLPEKRYIGSYYINMEDYDKGNGTHWIFVLIKNKNNALYFDSYGSYIPTDILNFLDPFRPIPTNKRDIQALESIKCGYFCIACDMWFKNNYNNKIEFSENYDDFINLFSENKMKNDKIVMELLKDKL